MAYIGKKVEETDLTNRTVDTMVGDGSDTTLTLSATPISVNNVLVFINGIMQRPTTDYTISGTTLTFGTAPFTGGIVVAITGGGEHIGVPLAKIATDKISDGAVTNAKINSLSASKITGALPALDGSALTGISAVSNITTSASDPTISSNPSSGLGTVWANTTSGETYILTDATAGSNVWTNVGPGIVDVRLNLGGTQFGWAIGGVHNTSPQTYTDKIEKFSFTSDANSTDIANLAIATGYGAGHSSYTHGYISGGRIDTSPGGGTRIEKFAFASTSNATKIADRTVLGYGSGGCNSSTYGYTVGGYIASPFGVTDTIDRFSFATDSDSTDVGDLIHTANYAIDCTQSITHGYSCGGAFPAVNIIAKWNFQGSFTCTDVGNLITANHWPACSHSATHGYVAGGHDGGTNRLNRIDKFSFASDGDATDMADLTEAKHGPSGTTSSTHGYVAGGTASPAFRNTIEKFSFASSANATDISDLTEVKRDCAGAEF